MKEEFERARKITINLARLALYEVTQILKKVILLLEEGELLSRQIDISFGKNGRLKDKRERKADVLLLRRKETLHMNRHSSPSRLIQVQGELEVLLETLMDVQCSWGIDEIIKQKKIIFEFLKEAREMLRASDATQIKLKQIAYIVEVLLTLKKQGSQERWKHISLTLKKAKGALEEEPVSDEIFIARVAVVI